MTGRHSLAGLGRPPLVIDGSHGEGGGQILRTALSLAAIAGRSVRFVNIRAGRPKPGLAAQHLTAVRAAAALCAARVTGDALGSVELDFAPQAPARPGSYVFDVAEARKGGSAGSVTLVLQTVLPPLALAEGRSTVVLRGGTHVDGGPSVDYAQEVWLPVLGAMGMDARLDLVRPGWFPIGQGEVVAEIAGGAAPLRPLQFRDRGAAKTLWGRATTSNLPDHVAQRMAGHAAGLLEAQAREASIATLRTAAVATGAALFLGADYVQGRGGATALGARGKPAEKVAEEAVAQLLAYDRSGAAVDSHLADQLIVPAALASGPSAFTTQRVTRHLTTNAWVVRQFGLAEVAIATRNDGLGIVEIAPAATC
ncbi:MAG TPA: RNA 3'-terminal phosphate cyclase [Alphaproteobacteria bacterium]|nr:RNA 3'-terminal phosphate cyclase [Alphaproteobacteria bacterium]